MKPVKPSGSLPGPTAPSPASRWPAVDPEVQMQAARQVCMAGFYEGSRQPIWPIATGIQSSGGTTVLYVNSPSLQALELAWQAGLLCKDVCQALRDLGADLVCIGPWPEVYLSAPGASCMCIEFDLSKRALELLRASRANQ
jgi:hypothetical protein